jgi:hypothetical protein
VIPYAPRTGTKSTLAIMADRGWHALISPKGRVNPLLPHDLKNYAVESGAYWSFLNKQPFDVPAYEFALDRFARDALWIVLPDIVGGGMDSLNLSRHWHADLAQRPALAGKRFLVAVQEGMEPADLADLVGPSVGLFIGGRSTEWKLGTLPDWCALGHARGAYIHVGRVNSTKRIAICAAAGAHSFDGSGGIQYPVTIARLDNARHQPDLFAQRRCA